MSDALLILASSSPRRQELIRLLGLAVELMPGDADESVEEGWTPAEIVEQLSLRKAESVRERAAGSGGVIIGSDTIVVLDGQVLGKPKDEEDAVRMLSALQGRTHQVFSGVALVDSASARRDEAVDPVDIGSYKILSSSPEGKPKIMVGHTASQVTFRPMSEEEIRAYVKTGEPMDKAGAYGVQGIGSVFIEKIEGDFYSIMGLPLSLVYQMLLKLGIQPFKL